MANDLFTLHEIQTRYVPRPDLGYLSPADLASVATPRGAARMALRYLRGQEVEHVIAILLSASLNTLCISIISKGTADAAMCNPRDLFREAVRHNATAIILAHNHPAGADSQPSHADVATTKACKLAGDILGIQLLDHIIIGGKGKPFSFRGEGLL